MKKLRAMEGKILKGEERGGLLEVTRKKEEEIHKREAELERRCARRLLGVLPLISSAEFACLVFVMSLMLAFISSSCMLAALGCPVSWMRFARALSPWFCAATMFASSPALGPAPSTARLA